MKEFGDAYQILQCYGYKAGGLEGLAVSRNEVPSNSTRVFKTI